MDKMYDIKVIEDKVEGGIRYIAAVPCDMVCSKQIDVEIQGDVVRRVEFTKGCHGNTQGVSALIAGMKVKEAVKRLEGIDCRGRGTSCPDQLARVLKIAMPVD